MIEAGEALKIEFKQKFSTHEKIAKEMIAFANTSGGCIIFGISDKKRVFGVDSEKTVAELIKQTADDYTEPVINYKIRYFDIDSKEIVVIEIPESETKPHRLQDYLTEMDINTAQVVVRLNDKSIPASKEMIRVLKARNEKKELFKYKVGKVEQSVFDFLEKNETITVKQLGEIANISNRRASRALVNMLRADLIIIHTKDNGEDFFTAVEN
jgi:predicted HTH transcriptional regulator